MLSRIPYWLRAILRRSALEREMRDEMQLHLDNLANLLVVRGMSRHDACDAARREFGNVSINQADARDARPLQWLDSVGVDLRFALRLFARKPLASTTTVLVLAIGIAGSATAYSMLQSAIMRPPPGVPSDASLVLLRRMARRKEQPLWSRARFSYPTLREMTALRSVFSAVAGWTESTVTVDVPGSLDGAVAKAQFVTDGYFSVLGLRAAYGSICRRRHRTPPPSCSSLL